MGHAAAFQKPDLYKAINALNGWLRNELPMIVTGGRVDSDIGLLANMIAGRDHEEAAKKYALIQQFSAPLLAYGLTRLTAASGGFEVAWDRVLGERKDLCTLITHMFSGAKKESAEDIRKAEFIMNELDRTLREAGVNIDPPNKSLSPK